MPFLQRTQQSSDVATEGHNLRTRSQRNRAENATEHIEDPDYHPTGDFLHDNEGLVECDLLHKKYLVILNVSYLKLFILQTFTIVHQRRGKVEASLEWTTYLQEHQACLRSR